MMYAIHLSYCLSVIVLFQMSCIAQDPVVNLPQGRIVGTKVYMEKSLIPIEIFYGIPYATAPTGRLRFSAPERHSGWKNVLYAYRPPPRCPESSNHSQYDFSEDCLHLNIWTPRIPIDGKALPVVVILYSESWSEAGVSLPCQDLAAEGIVVVTIDYRLHILGFLNLGDVAARGNLALLDQYLAFLWVRENISAFGGDPTLITLLGHSAGADSVLHHIVSPRSPGLFQKVIIMSPSDVWKVISNKEVVENDVILHNSKELVSSLGCTNTNVQEVLHCLRSRPLSAYLTSNWSRVLQPVPEYYLPESEQYLPTSLFKALTSTKDTMQFDILLGTTDLEALNFNDKKFEKFLNLTYSSDMSDYINKEVIPNLIRLFSQPQRPELLSMLVQVVRWEYWNGSSRKMDRAHDLLEYLAKVESAARWSTGIALLAARLARRVNHLYVYRYSIPSAVDLYGRKINFTGAVHGSDLISLLCETLMPQIARRPASSVERKRSAIFRRYIINFIKYGYPDDERTWPLYKVGDAHIFEITEKLPKGLHENSASRDVQFWLQYIPELSNSFDSMEQSEQYGSVEKDGNRLRGGVFAMCGVAAVLLLLLCVSAIILHKQHLQRRFSISDVSQNK